MLGSFIKNYLEIPPKGIKIVCLGGGVGTSQVLKGLRKYNFDLTSIVSMADDGGSAGRLRRAFSVPPPGDIVNCLAALSDEESILKQLLLYRFAGKRYGKDTDLGGQKLGNLIFVALSDIFKGDLNKALEEFSKIISSHGKVLPATTGDVNIWAVTKAGKKVFGEEKIDLGKYNGSKELSHVHLEPKNPKAYTHSMEAVKKADVIIAGPGDLFTTVLPVLIVPQIRQSLVKSSARKIFIVNVANKPFETTNYNVSDYLQALKNHLGSDIFDTIVVNNNNKPKLSGRFNYSYVSYVEGQLRAYSEKIITDNLIDENYPIYHDSEKLAKLIRKLIV
ncbi:MAG: hypothetical protein COU81_01150 [Candidatus Portnoybacteria bacterium CG10_big_fil_rev_8_21_14_0_10_36_7]|uniref:Putative gluconeogenesis factor n=1 Tax=Candidatus Portnoybacteria bacterium CG10_big_fil_rev_8_21_14_0_10_36_7 TaxID=1974812 RepID=A0A2M8KEQ2_9BACT|nr:MAG: hypothetical protein COU81_01150 [Candidatus Portnoybacteria bacterium CG10_big_fil_rev_8_21_14_0_10_36_7]